MSESLRAKVVKLQAILAADGVPELLDRATPELVGLLAASSAIATGRAQPMLCEHFVLAALADPRTAAMLSACGADLERTRRELAEFLDRPGISAEWTAHWDFVVLLARSLGSPRFHRLDIGHLLVCLRHVNGFATGLLAAQGVSLLRLREYAAHGSISLDDTPAIPKATVVGGASASARGGAYEIVLHDDDFTTQNVVVEILGKVFKKTPDQCAILVMLVSRNGSGAIDTCELRAALAKVEKATRIARAAEYPLKLTLRPVS